MIFLIEIGEGNADRLRGYVEGLEDGKVMLALVRAEAPPWEL